MLRKSCKHWTDCMLKECFCTSYKRLFVAFTNLMSHIFVGVLIKYCPYTKLLSISNERLLWVSFVNTKINHVNGSFCKDRKRLHHHNRSRGTSSISKIDHDFRIFVWIIGLNVPQHMYWRLFILILLTTFKENVIITWDLTFCICGEWLLDLQITCALYLWYTLVIQDGD